MWDVIVGDGMSHCHSEGDFYLIDPPWNMPELFAPCGVDAQRIVFCDPQSIGAAVELNGAPSWLFVWDCVSCWYVPNRPLKRCKLALFYGDIRGYNDTGHLIPKVMGPPRIVTNTRGSIVYRPLDGARLADVHQQPITSLRGDQPFSHAKPVHWVGALIANLSPPGARIVDRFCGSGAFGVAATMVGRDYIGYEISPDVAALATANISSKHRNTGAPAQGELWL